jgi:hypothetical protein
VGAIRAGLHHDNPAVREGCCRLLDHPVDTDSTSQLITMADDPDAQVSIAAVHALTCDRRKGDTRAAGADEVLEPALQHLASDPDAHVRTRAAELARKFVQTDGRAVTLETAHTEDPSPVARKKAGWFTPEGTIYQRTIHARPGNGTALNQPPVNGHPTCRCSRGWPAAGGAVHCGAKHRPGPERVWRQHRGQQRLSQRSTTPNRHGQQAGPPLIHGLPARIF